MNILSRSPDTGDISANDSRPLETSPLLEGSMVPVSVAPLTVEYQRLLQLKLDIQELFNNDVQFRAWMIQIARDSVFNETQVHPLR